MNTNHERHAYLVIAHHQFELLEMQLKLLDHRMHDFYIHIDASVKDFDFDYFRNIVKKSKVYFTPRIRVTWGGHSQIRCEQILLEEATKGKYGYYHLISGVDLPLKPAEMIYQYFQDHIGEEFCKRSDTRERVSLWHPFKDMYAKEACFYSFLDRVFMRLQRLLSVDRMKKNGYTVKCGANWFSISHELASFVCSKKKEIKRLFYYSHCGDEVFLHTLLFHYYGEKLTIHRKELGSDYQTLARLIDWERGDPYTFCSGDFDELMNSNALFARKFDYVSDPDICRKIYNALMERVTNRVY